MSKLYTSESVTEGHPDKLCDQIVDTILDECLKQDPESRVAVEAILKLSKAVIFGEITSKVEIDVGPIVKKVLKDVGYSKDSLGFSLNDLKTAEFLSKQSEDIAQGVTENQEKLKEQGAGDQGIMYGYACRETPELMPLPIMIAHEIAAKMAEVRKKGKIDYLRPDGKTQVTFEYENEKPKRLHTLVLSSQHSEDVELQDLIEDLKAKIIEPVCSEWLDLETIFHINPTGRFVIGGPVADSGLSGKKTGVDTYGGLARHGGGSFSGKDASKVDRSATYATRFVAKNLVANGICEKCEVSFAYAIGVAEPVAISVDTFETSKYSEVELIELIKEKFPTKPAEIIEVLNLKRPIYKDTAVYGHFGKPCYSWEKIVDI